MIKTKKTLICLIIVLILLFSGCAMMKDVADVINSTRKPTNNIVATMVNTPQLTKQLTPTKQPTPTPTLKPTPTPTPILDKPKYIFYVIGDGMGQGQLLLGEIYNRIVKQSMDDNAVWEEFTQKKFVDACGESASGGTALATGYETDEGTITRTLDNEDLYTIIDRAQENGLATGIITNASITDATPATFSAHSNSRQLHLKIAKMQPLANVDFLAGGGINYILSEETAKGLGKLDSSSYEIVPEGNDYTMKQYDELGYSSYFGMNGAIRFADDAKNDSLPDKVLAVFTSGNMPYQITKSTKKHVDSMANNVDLLELTKAGIDILSRDEDGFIFVIEQAFIDKTSHKGKMTWTGQEMNMLDKVLSQIMEFYNQHPDETLIILSADHETGDYSYSLDRFDEFLEKDDFQYSQDEFALQSFMIDSWGVNVSSDLLESYIELADEKLWIDPVMNNGYLYNYLASETAINYGIEINTEDHSGQQVPCYSMGVKAELFSSCLHIKDIAPLICKIMKWEELPEIVEEE